MSVPKSWRARVAPIAAVTAVHCALVPAALADVTMSQSNSAAMSELGTSLTAMLAGERAALGAISGDAVAALVRGPGAATAASGAAAPQAGAEADAPKLAAPGKARKLKAAAPKNGATLPSAGDPAVLAAVKLPTGGAEFTCLATALYHEARGESLKGQAAVGEVILNRVASGAYPRSICGVVNQQGNGGCQFSYTCDGRSDAIADRAAWDRAARVAAALMAGAPRSLTGGATHFHTPKVRPDWSRKFAHTVTIGGHIFYRQPIRTAMN
jgi:spore germination cell wall hydrolase CwlJ-like protein